MPDLLFDIFPDVKLDPMSDVILYILLMSLVFRIIFHPRGLSISRRFIVICGCVYFVRSLTLVVTSFPDPQARCQDYDASWSLWGAASFSCGDMMFSGRTVLLMLVALCWTEYTKSIVVRCVIWVVAIAGMLSLIISRSHYTIDILISIFVTALIWMQYHYLVALCTHPKYRNRIVAWLEKLDSEIVSETSSSVLLEEVHKSFEPELSDVKKSPKEYRELPGERDYDKIVIV